VNIFLDCEFNSFGGKLLSLAMIDDADTYFYEIIHYDNIKYDPWVSENVLPIMKTDPITGKSKDPIPFQVFQHKLYEYLNPYYPANIICDWPDDIKYLCETLMTGPGIMIPLNELNFYMSRSLGTSGAKPQHNALADAIAIRDNYYKLQNDKIKFF